MQLYQIQRFITITKDLEQHVEFSLAGKNYVKADQRASDFVKDVQWQIINFQQ